MEWSLTWDVDPFVEAGTIDCIANALRCLNPCCGALFLGQEELDGPLHGFIGTIEVAGCDLLIDLIFQISG